MLGVALDWCNRLIVILACSRSLSHNDGGNRVRCLTVWWGSAPWNFVWRLLLHFCGVCLVVLILVESCIHLVLLSSVPLILHCPVFFLGIIPARRSLNIIAIYARVSSSYLRGFYEYHITVYFHHNHDVLFASLWACWELPFLVREDSVPYFVHACVYVTCILSLECSCFGHLEGDLFGFGGPDIFLDCFRWLFGVLLVSG